MEEILIKGAQLILSLSILVVLHELGHFIPAKLFGTRVEKFYLFFDPWFSLFKFKKGDTEYGVGWLPLGGYVKISGMIDESMDKEQMAQPAQPWEFRSKPTWQRLIIMIGGVTVNIILGFFIYSMVLFKWGEEKIPFAKMQYGVTVDSTLLDYGFQNGDRIVDLPGREIKYLSEVGTEILIHGAREVEIVRNGQTQLIQLPEDFEQTMIANEVKSLFGLSIPFVVQEPVKDGTAEKAGVLAGDTLLGINDLDIINTSQAITTFKKLKDQDVDLKIKRGTEIVHISAHVSDQGTIGVALVNALDFLETETYNYTFWESFPAGVKKTGTVLSNYVSSMALLFTPEGAGSIGGFGSIGGLFEASWDWQVFWTMTAFLSIVLAFMNILPIPALDGGHVLFLLYEMITGRKPGEKFMEYAQTAGMLLLLLLLLFANGNDIVRAMKDAGWL